MKTLSPRRLALAVTLATLTTGAGRAGEGSEPSTPASTATTAAGEAARCGAGKCAAGRCGASATSPGKALRMAGPPLEPEQLEALMKSNKAELKRLEAAVAAQDQAAALAALATLAENAKNATRSDPQKDKEHSDAYLALFEGLRWGALGTAETVKSGNWAAVRQTTPGLKSTCKSCHERFREDEDAGPTGAPTPAPTGR